MNTVQRQTIQDLAVDLTLIRHKLRSVENQLPADEPINGHHNVSDSIVHVSSAVESLNKALK